MAWFNWFNKKNKSENYTFTDTDRSLSIEKRRVLSEIRFEKQLLELERMREERDRLRQERLEAFDFDDDEEEEKEESAEMLLIKALIPQLQMALGNPIPDVGSNSQQEVLPPKPNIEPTQEISDEQIKNMIANIPKSFLRMGKALNDNQLHLAIKAKMPGLDIHTINRAIKIYRENF